MDSALISGLDFIVQEQKLGVQEEIEFKETMLPTFTPMQWLRFREGEDIPKNITRLCLIHPSRIKNFAVKVCFWSPNFFQTLPREAFEDMPYAGGSKFLRWQGLGGCLEQNRENNLFEVIGGEFGYPGVKYKLIPMIEAYEFLYQKLVHDIKNPLEEAQKIYRPCNIQISLGERIKSVLLTILNYSYRPMYAEDFISTLWDNFAEHMSQEGEVAMIKRVKASDYVHRKLTEIEDIIVYQFENYRYSSYGLKTFHDYYIPLKKAPSNFLDLLKYAWEETGEREFTLKKLAPLSTRNTGASLRANVPKFRKDLEKAGLIEYNLKLGFPSEGVFILTDKCLKYITRI